jgi:hypothetical protein
MKTIKELEIEINSILLLHDQLDFKNEKILENTELNKVKKRYNFLKTCLLYLLTDPKEYFIKKEIERLKNRLILIDFDYADWCSCNYYKNNREVYERINNCSELKQKINILKFILNG